MKRNQKGFTLVELLAVIVILAVIILIAVNAVLPQMQKARKKSFADEGLSFAKAAENAYVDRQETGTKAFTVTDLKSNYVTKSDANYRGCIVIMADDQGNILGKKIFLGQAKESSGEYTEKKFMIVNYTADNLGKDLDKAVKTFATSGDPSWDAGYDSCTITNAVVHGDSSTGNVEISTAPSA